MNADIRLVAIDETRYWREDIAQEAGKLFGVYMYDADQYTCCCEATASRLLMRVYTATEKGVSEDTHGLILEGDCQTEPDFYMHASRVEQLREVGRWKSDPDDSPEENIESAREYWQGNPPL